MQLLWHPVISSPLPSFYFFDSVIALLKKKHFIFTMMNTKGQENLHSKAIRVMILTELKQRYNE